MVKDKLENSLEIGCEYLALKNIYKKFPGLFENKIEKRNWNKCIKGKMNLNSTVSIEVFLFKFWSGELDKNIKNNYLNDSNQINLFEDGQDKLNNEKRTLYSEKEIKLKKLVNTEKKEILEKFKLENIKIVLIEDFKFFPLLENFETNDVMIFFKGKEKMLDVSYKDVIASVGSRNTPEKYRSWIHNKLEKLKEKKEIKAVVSGLAYGADLISHEEAIRLKIHPIIFHGFQIDYNVPKKKKHIYDVALEKGIIISTLSPYDNFFIGSLQKRNKEMAWVSNSTYVLYILNNSGTNGHIAEAIKKKHKVYFPVEVLKENKEYLKENDLYEENLMKSYNFIKNGGNKTMLENLKDYENQLNWFSWYAIVFYDKKNRNGIIKDIKSLKNIDDINPLNLLNNFYIKEFKNILDKILSNLEELGNTPILVFPPTKPNKKNQVIELIRILGYDLLKINYIELVSPIDFELKNKKTMNEREVFLENNYKKFEMKISNDYFKDKDKKIYIFIDDVITNGIFMYYCMKKISEEFDKNIFSAKKNSTRGLFLAKAEDADLDYYKKYKTIIKEKWIE